MTAKAPYDAATLRFYSNEADTYAADRSREVSRHLDAFLHRLPAGSRILELGCGGGADAEAMLKRGFLVDATDGTPEMARKAEERIGQTVRVMRFDQLHSFEIYDAVWANASLHVPRDALPGVLELIYRALRPGGLHFASFKGGGAEGRDRFGRYFNYFDASQLFAAYRASASWEVLATDEYEGGSYEGRQGPKVAITVRKPLN